MTERQYNLMLQRKELEATQRFYIKEWEIACGQYEKLFSDGSLEEPVQLRYCNARVYDTPDWYLLQSYDTMVAAIRKATGDCYDALRYVYGYTATSASHIAKFRNDYGAKRYCRIG